MSILIGHASIDENGKVHSGNAGDQTGRELYTRSWWYKNWNCMLRPKNSVLAEKSAKACEQACANNNIGYDQYQRNTLYTQAKAKNFDLSKINVKCECDCSSLMHVCAIAGGSKLSYGSNGLTTHTMIQEFVKTGDYEKLTDIKFLTSDKYLKRGDILVNTNSHTVMVLENGPGVEYKESKGGNTVQIELIVLTRGSKGEQVKTLQRLLKALGYNCGSIDGEFGPNTYEAVKKYQSKHSLVVDGIVGKNTWESLLK